MRRWRRWRRARLSRVIMLHVATPGCMLTASGRLVRSKARHRILPTERSTGWFA